MLFPEKGSWISHGNCRKLMSRWATVTSGLVLLVLFYRDFVQQKSMNKKAYEHLQIYPLEITIFNTGKQINNNNKLEAPVTAGCVIASAFPAWKVALPTPEGQEQASGHKHSELHPGELLLQINSEENSSSVLLSLIGSLPWPWKTCHGTLKIQVDLLLERASFPKAHSFKKTLA